MATVGTTGAIILFGTAGAGLTGWKMNTRWGSLQEFLFEKIEGSQPSSVQLAVCVPGTLDIEHPESMHEQFEPITQSELSAFECNALVWESRVLKNLRVVLSSMVGKAVGQQAASLWLQASATVAAASLMWPVWIVSSMADLDNAWLVAKERALQAGAMLARALADKAVVGQRPVTLVGYSVGARVIYYCLQELYKLGEFNIVTDVVLVGAPVSTLHSGVTGSKLRWRQARSVVSGRFVNCYSKNDWVLGFLYR